MKNLENLMLEKNWISKEKVESEIKRERHYFGNNLQVIYGYLKLNKEKKAIQSIEKLINYLQIQRKLQKLVSLEFQFSIMFFMEHILKISEKVELEVFTNMMFSHYNSIDIQKNEELLKQDIQNILNSFFSFKFEKLFFMIEESECLWSFHINFENKILFEKIQTKTFENLNGCVFFENEKMYYELEFKL